MLSEAKIVLECKIILHRGETNGLKEPIKNRARPSFGYEGNLIACEIFAVDMEYLPIDQEFIATLTLPYGKDIGLKFIGSEKFTLNIASTIIGEGHVLSEL